MTDVHTITANLERALAARGPEHDSSAARAYLAGLNAEQGAPNPHEAGDPARARLWLLGYDRAHGSQPADTRLDEHHAAYDREEQQLTAEFYEVRPYLRGLPIDQWTDDELDAHAECVGDFYDRRKRATIELHAQLDAELTVRLREVIAAENTSDRIRSLVQAYADGLNSAPGSPNAYAVPTSPPHEPDVHHAQMWRKGNTRARIGRHPYSGLAQRYAATSNAEPDQAYYDAGEHSPHLFPELYDPRYELDALELRLLGIPD